MPLVTRQVNQGVFFRTDTEPPDWQTGDIWIDTDNSNMAINRSGTSVQQLLGTYVQGDILHASLTDTITRLAAGTAGQALVMNSGGTLPEWGTGGQWELLDAHDAAEAEAVFTFTPSTAITFATHSAILIIIDGEMTGTNELRLTYNGITGTGYLTQTNKNDNGTLTGISTTGAAGGRIGDSAITTANRSFQCVMYIVPSDETAQSDFHATSVAVNSADGGIFESTGIIESTTVASITEIEFVTSTSTWKTGTNFRIYGLRS